MKAYEIKPDDDGWSHDYCIDASHRWGLPGVRCSDCGFVGGVVGLQYPAYSLPGDIDPAPYLEGWPVTLERQSELQSQLLSRWGKDVMVSPGTRFGLLGGKAWGKAGDVGWVNDWTPLLAATAIDRLREVGINSLTLVPTQIKWRSKTAPVYLELQIPPGLKLNTAYIESLGISRCGVCSILWRGMAPPDRAARLVHAELENDPVLESSSLPLEWDLLRIQDREGTIVASERFRTAAIKIGLTNIAFRELTIRYSESAPCSSSLRL